ncbi:MAG: hypothetical protein VX463_02405, partial [Pseudomonadota bacterium]|nr:hypothetical protein [Pseudomonadota bacterium]
SGYGIFTRVIGEAPGIGGSEGPEFVGLPAILEIGESDANAGVPIFGDVLAAVSDADSADFSGGRLLISRYEIDGTNDRYLGADGPAQDNMEIVAGGRVTLAGATVRVDGVDVATILSDGADGADLELTLLAGATLDRMEALLGAITYSNDSDDPIHQRRYTVSLTDGDGGVSADHDLRIRVAAEPEADLTGLEQTQVNAYEPGNQTVPAVAALTGGGWVTVWASQSQDRSDWGVYAQVYDAQGGRVGGEFLVAEAAAGTQYAPDVIGLSNGDFAISWQGAGADDSDSGVYTRVFDASGAPQTGAILANDVTAYDQYNAVMAAIPAGAGGGYYVAWQSYYQDGGYYHRYVQRFDASGQKVSFDGATPGVEVVQIDPNTHGSLTGLSITVLTNGALAAAWSYGNDSYYSVWSSGGAPLAVEQLLHQTAVNSQGQPVVGADASGGFWAAWSDNNGFDGSGWGIMGRRFDATGTAISDEFLVNDVVYSTQEQPQIVGLSDGRMLIGFRDEGGADGSSWGAYGQLFAADGSRIDDSFRINQDTNGAQDNLDLAALPGGDFVAVWSQPQSTVAGDGQGESVEMRVFGDPADYMPGSAPTLVGLPTAVSFDESDVNAALQLLDPAGSVALGDLDSPNFDGGMLTLAVAFDAVGQLEAERTGVDSQAQHVLGLVVGDNGGAGAVTVAGSTVSVNGVAIGSILSDGTGGDPLSILFNASATVEAVEAVIASLGYMNLSDDPSTGGKLMLDLSDGDGGHMVTKHIGLTVAAEAEDGVAPGAEFDVNATSDSIQTQPDAAQLDNGNVVIVWSSYFQDQRNDSYDYGVYAQIVDAEGVPVGPEFRVNTAVTGSQSAPRVAALDGGDFVVVWWTDGGGPGQILAQRYNGDGSADGAPFTVSMDAAFARFDPDITALADGGYVVSFLAQVSGGDYVVRQKTYDAADAVVGAEQLVNGTDVSTVSSERSPAVAALFGAGGTDAGHVVAWVADGTDGSGQGVFFQRYDAAGAAAGGATQVNVYAEGDQHTPEVVGLSGGGFAVILLSDGNAERGAGVFARLYDAAGVAQGDEFRVSPVISETGLHTRASATDDGGFVVSWTAPDGSSNGVFAQRFDAAGARIDGVQRVHES